MKVGMLLSDLLGKAGVDLTSEDVKSVLSIGVDIDDEIAGQVQKGLFNLEVAKSNKDLKNHFVGKFASGLDQDINEHLTGLGRQDILDMIKDIKGTGERARTVISELGKIKPVTGKEGSKEWEDTSKAQKAQIDKLIADLAAKDKQWEEKERKLMNQFDEERVNEAVMSKFNSLQWSELIPEVVRKDVAQKLLNSALVDKKAIVKKDENGNIQLLSVETNSPVIDEKNHVVTLDGLINNLMVNNKLLKVSDVVAPLGGGTQQHQQRVIPQKNSGTDRSNRNVDSAIDRAMSDQGV